MKITRKTTVYGRYNELVAGVYNLTNLTAGYQIFVDDWQLVRFVRFVGN